MNCETGKRVILDDGLVPIAIKGPTPAIATTDDLEIPAMNEDETDAASPQPTIRTKFPESWIWETLEEYVHPFAFVF